MPRLQKLLASALAAMIALSSAAGYADDRSRRGGDHSYQRPGHRPGQAHQRPGHRPHAARPWMRHGGHLPRGYGHRIPNYHRYGLRPPPRGYRWVRYRDNYLLVAIATGIIAGIIAAQPNY